jgi:hypothetical protein
MMEISEASQNDLLEAPADAIDGLFVPSAENGL